jgi:DNA-binding LacI/PurR family transcriptional regulator
LETHAAADLWRSAAVDGMLWWGAPIDDELLALRCPAIGLNSRPDHRPHHYVAADSYGGAQLMVRHLVELGHRGIGFIAGPEGLFETAERLAGYLAAMRSFGLDPVVEHGDLFSASGVEATRRLVEQVPRPTAIFAANDLMAIGGVHAARAFDLQVPEQFAVVGADGSDQLGFFHPGITTIQMDMHRVAEVATQRLLALIRGELGDPAGRVEEVVPVTLVIRETCGYARRFGSTVTGWRAAARAVVVPSSSAPRQLTVASPAPGTAAAYGGGGSEVANG